jgi:DNA-binding transcriptional MerR regulator
MADVQSLLVANEKLSQEVLRPGADQIDQSRRFPRENIAALGKAGVLGLLVPTQFGGAGASLGEMSRLQDTQSQACASTAMVTLMHYCATAVIAAKGGDRLKQDLLPSFARAGHLSTPEADASKRPAALVGRSMSEHRWFRRLSETYCFCAGFSRRPLTSLLTLECIRGLILHMVQTANATFHSGELAEATGVSADTIRHYERIGVLPKAPRTTAGYRVYSQSAVKRVLVTQRALRIGFTLSELAEIFRTKDAGGTPCHRVFELAQDKLHAIEADIAALKETRSYLVKVLADWDTRIKKSRGRKAHLLQSLTAGVKSDVRTNFRRKRR